MQVFDKFFFFFFRCKCIIMGILSYQRKFIQVFIFRWITIGFAYLCTHFFFLKRKADQEFIFFLIDPNIRVYCYIFAFFLFIFVFFIIYFVLYRRVRSYNFFLLQEFVQIFWIFFIIVYVFFWSYIFIDIDLKKTFFWISASFY